MRNSAPTTTTTPAAGYGGGSTTGSHLAGPKGQLVTDGRPVLRGLPPRLPEGGRRMVVLRRTIGDVLRDERRGQQRTLREVSSTARVSLGYLSEVERGQKEASSELLASICGALDVPLSQVLGEVTRRIAVEEGVRRPYAAEGIVPAPTVATEPVLVPVAASDVTPTDALEAAAAETVDGAVESIVDSALEELAAATASEFAVQLDGLPAELELILRRRLVPAA